MFRGIFLAKSYFAGTSVVLVMQALVGFDAPAYSIG